jgi:hypothetical protein
MAEEDVVFVGARGVARVVAGLFVVGGVVFALWSLVAMGASGIPAALIGLAALSVSGVAILRVRVSGTPAGLVVCNGFVERRYPWGDVESFRIQERGTGRGVYALLLDGRMVGLPVANGGPLLTRRKELTTVREALDAYRLRVL